MLGKEARLRNRQAELRQFLRRFCPTLDKPRRRFFFQSMVGIMLGGSLVISRWLRFIADRCRDRFWRHKRLLNQINHGKWDHVAVLKEYQRQWAGKIGPDTPLIIDLSDLPRPRARKLKYIAHVRDGSDDGRLVNGYWCLEIYAYLGKRRLAPMLLHPFSSDDPDTISENAMILRCVDQVLDSTGGRGVLLMDRGADRDRLLIPWIDDARKFVVCLRGDRHLLLEDGTGIEAKLLIETLLNRGGGRSIVCCRVALPERPHQPLWLVGKLTAGRNEPLILLSSLRADDLAGAKVVLQYYRCRWSCEESVRFLKTDLGIEQIALRTYESFARLLLLATLTMGFLTWLQLLRPKLLAWLRERHPGMRRIKFAYYRMLRWLQNSLDPVPTARCPPQL